MTSRDVVERFWRAMQANDWEQAAACLSPTVVIDWPCSGERICGREDFITIQVDYPSVSGHWTFELHRIVVEGDVAVSEVTVTDGDQAARTVAFSEIADGMIVRQVEYWPTAYDPPPGREGLTRPTERIP